MPLKQDTEPIPLHIATKNTETPPNSVSTFLKTTTLIILFPGAYFHHTSHTVAPVKNVTYAFKKNF